jgi:RHS repeat-associated protein
LKIEGCGTQRPKPSQASRLRHPPYDTENNLTSIKDALNRTTSFTYNSHRWVSGTTFPSTYTETYSYDNVGNLTSKYDRKFQTISYTYDALNRLTKKTYPGSATVTYTYDYDSHLTQVADATGTYGFTYDNMGRLTGTSTQYAFLSGSNFTNSYTYDAASNRAGYTAPDSSTISYVYDTLNRLTALTSSWAGYFGFNYDSLSRRTQLTRPNGVNTSYTYDSLSRLLSVLHQAPGGTIDGATYTVDAAGNRMSKADELAGVTSSYTYDAIYQLTQVTQAANTTESYSYDAAGNRTASLGVSPYTVNSSNELTAIPGVTYTYDRNGNTLTKVVSGATTTYAWDYENRLTSVTLPNSGGTVTFKYDPFGRRIEKISPTTTSVFAYDGDNLVETVNASGAEVASYAQGDNIDEPLAMDRSGTVDYYEQDGIGSVTSLTNAAGALAQTYTFDSFGNTTNSSGSLTNFFRYTGREFDTETGLYFDRARYLDPSTGRFLSEDPLEFGGEFNFYRYVENNPVLLIDPFGTSSLVFNRANGTLTLLDKNGNVVIVCDAGNNTTKHSNGPWPNGTYPYSGHNNHPADPNGPYGSHGIFIFNMPGRSGMGVHSGRQNSGGPNHPTLGCVRTTDNCMQQISNFVGSDPLKNITIQ